MIEFNKQKLKKLKKAYNKCTGKIFIFEGHKLLKDYAKYLIQYLELEFK